MLFAAAGSIAHAAEPPIVWEAPQTTLQDVLAETNQVATPSERDRERITDALRARLGTAVLPEGFLPPGAGVTAWRSSGRLAASRAGLGRGGWLGVVGGTAVVAGVLGFALGYGMAKSGRTGDEAVAVPAAPAPASAPTTEESRGSDPTGVGRSGASSGSDMPGDGVTSTRSKHGRPREPERAGREERAASIERTTRTVPVKSVRHAEPEASGLSFAEVLERLQRANLALREGQASLALIQLSELDRRGGHVLGEEREATRVLALCAIGDSASARHAAASLRATGSIYARRLDASCARERDEP